jgi:hypothetical protein
MSSGQVCPSRVQKSVHSLYSLFTYWFQTSFEIIHRRYFALCFISTPNNSPVGKNKELILLRMLWIGNLGLIYSVKSVSNWIKTIQVSEVRWPPLWSTTNYDTVPCIVGVVYQLRKRMLYGRPHLSICEQDNTNGCIVFTCSMCI